MLKGKNYFISIRGDRRCIKIRQIDWQFGIRIHKNFKYVGFNNQIIQEKLGESKKWLRRTECKKFVAIMRLALIKLYDFCFKVEKRLRNSFANYRRSLFYDKFKFNTSVK